MWLTNGINITQAPAKKYKETFVKNWRVDHGLK